MAAEISAHGFEIALNSCPRHLKSSPKSFLASDLAVCVDLLVVGLVTSTPLKWNVEPVDGVVLACFPTGGVKLTLIGPSIDLIAEELMVE